MVFEGGENVENHIIYRCAYAIHTRDDIWQFSNIILTEVNVLPMQRYIPFCQCQFAIILFLFFCSGI